VSQARTSQIEPAISAFFSPTPSNGCIPCLKKRATVKLRNDLWKKKELKLPAPLKSIAAYLAKRKWSTIQKYFLSEFNSEKIRKLVNVCRSFAIEFGARESGNYDSPCILCNSMFVGKVT